MPDGMDFMRYIYDLNTYTMKKISNHLFALLCLVLLTAVARAGDRSIDEEKLEGRWDLTIMMAGKKSPGWLEVRHSGSHALVGQVVVVVGSARPISRINVNGNKFGFAIPP